MYTFYLKGHFWQVREMSLIFPNPRETQNYTHCDFFKNNSVLMIEMLKNYWLSHLLLLYWLFLQAAEKLEILTLYLRNVHVYCVWCGTSYNGTSHRKM